MRTQNPVLCLVAEEYLIHDLTLQKAKTMTGYDEWDSGCAQTSTCAI